MNRTICCRTESNQGLTVYLLAVLWAFSNVYADQPYTLRVDHGGVPGSECIEAGSARDDNYLIGMVGTTVVMIEYPDSIELPYQGIQEWTWPRGLVIEASIQSDTVATQFNPSPAILYRLNLRYFVERSQAFTDSMWRNHGVIPPSGKLFSQPHFWFQHYVAPEWAGKYLGFRARYDSPIYGEVSSSVTFFTVSAPCSDADTDQVNVGNIVAAGYERDYSRSFAIADSLFAAGWVNRWALSFLNIWSREQHRYSDRLRYLDIEFLHYGNIGASHGEEVTPITPESRAEYERARQETLQAKAAYEAQQR